MSAPESRDLLQGRAHVRRARTAGPGARVLEPVLLYVHGEDRIDVIAEDVGVVHVTARDQRSLGGERPEQVHAVAVVAFVLVGGGDVLDQSGRDVDVRGHRGDAPRGAPGTYITRGTRV